MIPFIWNTLTSPEGITIVILIIISVASTYYAYKAWDTAESLRRVIDLSPEVCEICATSETHHRHRPDYPIGTHAYVPAHLVFTPPPQDLG